VHHRGYDWMTVFSEPEVSKLEGVRGGWLVQGGCWLILLPSGRHVGNVLEVT